MYYIYKIENTVNQKVYIGQTIKTPDERWKEHLYTVKKAKNPTSSLYRAMIKYGSENFSVSEIERLDCSREELSAREIYWIAQYNSYKEGYNDTIGGQGKCLYPDEEILSLLLTGIDCKTIKETVGCCQKVITRIAKNNDIYIDNNKTKKIPIAQFDLKGNYLQTFPSYADAAKWLIDNNYTKANVKNAASYLGEVVKGKGKTAYKFIWKKET